MAFLPIRKRRREEPLNTFRSEMDRLFEDFFGAGLLPARSGVQMPSVDVSETDGEIEVVAEIPGVKAENVKITAEDDVLTIKGEKKVERETKEKDWYMTERSYGSFSRAVGLPTPVDAAGAQASFEDGVLTIKLPKRAEEKERKVEIQVKK